MTRLEFIAHYAGGYFGDEQSMKARLEELAGKVWDSLEGNLSAIVIDGITYQVEVKADNVALDAGDSGKIFLMGTNAKSFALPATVAGLKYTFINTGADGNNNVTVSPIATDKIMGSFNNGGNKVVMSGTDNKDLVNTAATSKRGDRLTLVGDGVDGWYIEEAIGIWTEESQTAHGVVSEVEIVTDNRVLTAADSGKIFGCGTDAKAFTLPSTVAGLKYTFINTGAPGNNPLNISPAAADGISGTFTLAASVVVGAGVVNKDIINTKGTSQCGDSVTIIGTGVAGTHAWIVIASTGIWAAEG